MKMKKLSLIFALILLTVVLTIPVAAEPDYSIGTPEQAPITLDDVGVPLGEVVDIPGDDRSSGTSGTSDMLEVIEIELPPTPLGEMSSAVPVASVIPRTVPQTGDSTLASIILCVTSGFGLITTAFFVIRKRKMSKI